MADFARCGAAAAIALGRSKGEFLLAYEQNVNRQNEAAIEASPVAQAVIKFMENRDKWEGTASELLSELETIAQDNLSINIKRKPWPQGPHVLWRRLQEVRPNLLAENISVERDRTGSRRLIRLRRVVGESSQSSSPSGEAPDVGKKRGDGSPDDGCDGDDGSPGTSGASSKVHPGPTKETPEDEAFREAKKMFPALYPEDEQGMEVEETPNNDEE
jgi:hypothetical protein